VTVAARGVAEDFPTAAAGAIPFTVDGPQGRFSCSIKTRPAGRPDVPIVLDGSLRRAAGNLRRDGRRRPDSVDLWIAPAEIGGTLVCRDQPGVLPVHWDDLSGAFLRRAGAFSDSTLESYSPGGRELVRPPVMDKCA